MGGTGVGGNGCTLGCCSWTAATFAHVRCELLVLDKGRLCQNDVRLLDRFRRGGVGLLEWTFDKAFLASEPSLFIRWSALRATVPVADLLSTSARVALAGVGRKDPRSRPARGFLYRLLEDTTCQPSLS